MALWVGPGWLSIGGDEFIKPGEVIPGGIFEDERISEFCDRGWAKEESLDRGRGAKAETQELPLPEPTLNTEKASRKRRKRNKKNG